MQARHVYVLGHERFENFQMTFTLTSLIWRDVSSFAGLSQQPRWRRCFCPARTSWVRVRRCRSSHNDVLQGGIPLSLARTFGFDLVFRSHFVSSSPERGGTPSAKGSLLTLQLRSGHFLPHRTSDATWEQGRSGFACTSCRIQVLRAVFERALLAAAPSDSSV